ncbi:hypothetical protein [Legionella jamestowniensis]|uniref:Uncharacterized protein n=1 Tax=Legionella jamestowniensis TaxID=455 RepID=A0A0W0UGS5_9GAMM|nr:hypothetical protein [Legionella jamestowniensis]KTD06924.1 hypothetical protein Ljam_1119 [Legionella jamestowniensis]SFL85040.1 hypothetical protein SAMN02746073_2249 [Legionella jamestowniensis DSM 19215]
MESLSPSNTHKRGLFTPLKTLFYGEFPLWATFWIFGVLVITLINIGFYFIISNIITIVNKIGTFPIYGLILLAMIYIIFIWIAIWNSASNYQGSKILAILTKVIVILSVAFTLLFFYLNSRFNAQNTDQKLNAIATLLNKNLPAKIDNHTELVKVASDKNKLIYYFQLINFNANEKSSILSNREEALKKLDTSIKENVCSSREMKRFIDQNIELVYSYSLDGQQLFSIPVNEGTCNY